jgi:two-component system chemotaxis response regulator CheB
MRAAPARLRVAVVDDSSFIRKAIARMFEDDRQVEIVGLASSGEELLAQLDEWQPEAVTLDLSMPGMGGLRTLDHIMARRPTPVIILSTHSAKDAPLTIEALHRGAVDFIDKACYSLVDFGALREAIREKLMSVRAVSLVAADSAPPPEVDAGEPPPPEVESEPACRFDALVIGASTGGPPTLQRILEDLGPRLPLPVLVVQHMPVGFTRAFAERLNTHLPLQVREAVAGEPLAPSTVYIGPAGWHFRLQRSGSRLLASLSTQPKQARHRPSVDVLFESAASTLGERSLAVLLTGMGDDGAQGMAQVREVGGYTVAQDAASCVVHGMPRAAEELGAVCETVPLDRLGRRLLELLSQPEGGLASAGSGSV